MTRHSSARIVIALLIPLLAATMSMAQDSLAGVPIQFAGRVEAVDGTSLTVNQLLIDVSAAEVSTPLQADSQIVIRGILLDNGVIAAQVISIYLPPPTTSMPTEPAQPPTLLPTEDFTPQGTAAPLVIEGPVQAIEGNRIQVNDMVFEFEPGDPMFDVLRVGDVLRIEGTVSQIGDQTALTITGLTIVSRASDDGSNGDDEEEGTGMGMGMGMGN
jgi:hypothetical protein